MPEGLQSLSWKLCHHYAMTPLKCPRQRIENITTRNVFEDILYLEGTKTVKSQNGGKVHWGKARQQFV